MNTLRQIAIKADNAGWFCRELAFNRWCRETVFPDAVVRHIEAIGAETLRTDQELRRLHREAGL